MLVCAVVRVPVQAAIYTWTGGGGLNTWNDAGNWTGGPPAPPPTATGHSLIFAGNLHLSNNNTHITSVNGIEFAAGAGNFVLSGNEFTLNGNIINRSGVLQTIANDLILNGNRQFNTEDGDITITGDISETGGVRQLFKYGTGTLTLAGSNSFSGGITLSQGRLLLDTKEGGTLHSTYNVMLGAQNFVSNINQGGVLEIKGKSTGTTLVQRGQLYMGRSTGANRIVIDANGGDGTTLEFSSWGWNSSPSDNGAPVLNVQLLSANSHLKLPLALTNGIHLQVTVTDSVKTGFATVDGNGFVVRNTDTTLLPTTNAFNNNNYHTSGALSLTGNVTGNSLTITGAGSMTGATRTAQVRGILMEEGVTDYTLDVLRLGWGGLNVYQYSQDGVLTIKGDLNGQAGGNYSGSVFLKAGPGTVVFEGDAPLVAGFADIHEGLLRLDGSLKDVKGIQVRSGAVLGGSGEIGGGDVWTWSGTNVKGGTRYSEVHVYTGATLDASDGLQITGTLILYEDATFRSALSLTQQALHVIKDPLVETPVVTLAGDLQLDLLYAILPNTTITLLTTTGILTGEFDTVNGVEIGEEGLFSLFYNAKEYEFLLQYSSNSVSLIAIPEPSTVTLLLGAGALGFLVLRRRQAAL